MHSELGYFARSSGAVTLTSYSMKQFPRNTSIQFKIYTIIIDTFRADLYPSDAGSSILAGSRLVKILTGDPFFLALGPALNRGWLS